MDCRSHRPIAIVLAVASGCSSEVVAWRAAPTCPVLPGGERQLEFGRSYLLRVEEPLFGEPPPTAALIEDGRVTGRVELACVTTRVATDDPRWIGPGGATLFDGPDASAPALGRLGRDTPVHSLGATAGWHLIAVGGHPSGYVRAFTLVARRADSAALPAYLAAADAGAGAEHVAAVLADLEPEERIDPRVTNTLAAIVNGALDRGERASAATILAALDREGRSRAPWIAASCRLAASGFVAPWTTGERGDACPEAPALPEVYPVAVEAERECPRDTELLGAAVAGTATAWACHTPDAILLDRPVGDEIDLSYEARLDHVFVRDSFGRIADLIDDAGLTTKSREGRWEFRDVHVVGLGACLEWHDTTKGPSVQYLSCFPPPPTNPEHNRELIKVGATRRDGTSWHRRWSVVRGAGDYLLCLRSDTRGDRAYRFLPGRIRRARRWPEACAVTDAVAPALNPP